MARTVSVNITSHPLSREESGVSFVVVDDGAKLGELVVSKGGIRWKPKNKRDHHFMNWNELDATMRDYLIK
jgi:hypothetical protein